MESDRKLRKAVQTVFFLSATKFPPIRPQTDHSFSMNNMSSSTVSMSFDEYKSRIKNEQFVEICGSERVVTKPLVDSKKKNKFMSEPDNCSQSSGKGEENSGNYAAPTIRVQKVADST